MKILLLGKDGQVGWQLQRSLAPHGDVVACNRAQCDLSDIDRIRSVVREVSPDVIVNAAAYTAVDKAESELEQARLINSVAPGILAEEAARLGAMLVHYSADYVYDGTKESPYVETDLTGPLNVYGQTKLGGEDAIRAAACKSIIFRIGWVFGARGNSFVKTILRLAREKDQLDVVADQFGSPTPAAMVATVTGVVVAMLKQGRELDPGECRLYHLAAATPASWCGFAKTIVAQAALVPGFNLRLASDAIRGVATAEYPPAAPRPLNSRLDCRKLERDFGLQMPDWQPYLERMLQLLALKQNGY